MVIFKNFFERELIIHVDIMQKEDVLAVPIGILEPHRALLALDSHFVSIK